MNTQRWGGEQDEFIVKKEKGRKVWTKERVRMKPEWL